MHDEEFRMNYKTLLKPRKLIAVLKQRLAIRAALNRSIKLGVVRFRSDPNWRPDLVPGNFAPRKSPPQDDSALLKRISVAYQKAKLAQRSASETYNVSNEWIHIYERKLGPVMKALSEGDIPELDRIYSNFFRDSCSTGLAGLPSNLEKKYYGSRIRNRYVKIALIEALHRFDLWKQRTANAYTVKDLVSPIIGNPYGATIDGEFLRPGFDYHHAYAHEMKQLLASTGKYLIAELGGGFGGLGYYIVRDIPEMTYIDLDLPEAIALASYYLIKAFPDLPVALYGEIELNQETLNKYRIVMMPSFEITKMANKSVGITFNSYSLAEMSPSTIEEYIAELTRITSGYFLHINHSRNSVVSADNFGVEDRGFQLIRRRLAGWTVGLNPDSDEFEYLYKAN
jgi:putative sugar O-methyltransferase